MVKTQKYNSHKKKVLHLKKKIELPIIPMLKKPVIAINIDFKKKKEHLVIGDFDNINSFLRGQKDVEIIFAAINNFGENAKLFKTNVKGLKNKVIDFLFNSKVKERRERCQQLDIQLEEVKNI